MTKEDFRSADSRLLFMAATNFYDILDEALTRKGRIDTHICLNQPTEQNGTEILKRKIRNDESIHQDSVSDAEIQEAYQLLKQKIQQDYLETNRRKLRALYGGQLIHDVELQLREEAERQCPSIADILNYFEEVKTNSFYAQNNRKQIHLLFQ